MDGQFLPELNAWIDAVTANICAEAKPRIAAEIHEHYKTTYEQFLAAAHSEPEAHRRSMEQLGKPRRARHLFKRVYPTERQARCIRRFARCAESPSAGRTSLRIMVAALGVAIAIVAFAVMKLPGEPVWVYELIGAAFALIAAGQWNKKYENRILGPVFRRRFGLRWAYVFARTSSRTLDFVAILALAIVTLKLSRTLGPIEIGLAMLLLTLLPAILWAPVAGFSLTRTLRDRSVAQLFETGYWWRRRLPGHDES